MFISELLLLPSSLESLHFISFFALLLYDSFVLSINLHLSASGLVFRFLPIPLIHFRVVITSFSLALRLAVPIHTPTAVRRSGDEDNLVITRLVHLPFKASYLLCLLWLWRFFSLISSCSQKLVLRLVRDRFCLARDHIWRVQIHLCLICF